MKCNVKKIIFGVFLFLSICDLRAEGITRDMRDGVNKKEYSENGGYFEIGVGMKYESAGHYELDVGSDFSLIPVINFGYKWKDLFIDANEDDVFIFGANLINTERWSLDLVAGTKNPDPKIVSVLEFTDKPITAGIRTTGFFDTKIIQFEYRDDVSNYHGGQHASLLIGDRWQIRNFNLHMILGAHYSSSKLNDYDWGVPRTIASEIDLFSVYSPESSIGYTAEFGLTHAISESWVLKSTFNYRYRAREIRESFVFSLSENRVRDVFTFDISLNFVL